MKNYTLASLIGFCQKELENNQKMKKVFCVLPSEKDQVFLEELDSFENNMNAIVNELYRLQKIDHNK